MALVCRDIIYLALQAAHCLYVNVFWNMTQSCSENRISPSLCLQKCWSRYLIFNFIKSKLHKFIKAEYDYLIIFKSSCP